MPYHPVKFQIDQQKLFELESGNGISSWRPSGISKWHQFQKHPTEPSLGGAVAVPPF